MRSLSEKIAGYVITLNHLNEFNKKDVITVAKECNLQLIKIVEQELKELRNQRYLEETCKQIGAWLRYHPNPDVRYVSVYSLNENGTFDIYTINTDGEYDFEMSTGKKPEGTKDILHYLQLALAKQY